MREVLGDPARQSSAAAEIRNAAIDAVLADGSMTSAEKQNAISQINAATIGQLASSIAQQLAAPDCSNVVPVCIP